MGRKSRKLPAKSDLPDSIIQHILSFLPTTKQVIQTSVLSKRWNKQWTGVPVLIFDFSPKTAHFSDHEEISHRPSEISRFIDNVLIHHECSKIEKFHIKLDQNTLTRAPNYDWKLCFAIRKNVEELSLNLGCARKFKLPNFVFNCASLVRLQLANCTLMPKRGVNWENLKDLNLESCSWKNQSLENVVSRCQLLVSLVINNCQGFNRLDIASKSLKRLDLLNLDEQFVFEISCPNLEELYVIAPKGLDFIRMSDKAIQNVLSGSPLLEVLELNGCYGFIQLVIDSNSLKKLVLGQIISDDRITISCPSLEELNLKDLYTITVKLMKLPSLICVTLGFDFFPAWHCKTGWDRKKEKVRMVLEQIRHVKELKIESCCIKLLSDMEMQGESSPSLKIKCLTLNAGSEFSKCIPGIAYALRSSPELEELVITLQFNKYRAADSFLLSFSGENYWNSNGPIFDIAWKNI